MSKVGKVGKVGRVNIAKAADPNLNEFLEDAVALIEEFYVNPMPNDDALHGVSLEQHRAWAKSIRNRAETFLEVYHGKV